MPLLDALTAVLHRRADTPRRSLPDSGRPARCGRHSQPLLLEWQFGAGTGTPWR